MGKVTTHQHSTLYSCIKLTITIYLMGGPLEFRAIAKSLKTDRIELPRANGVVVEDGRRNVELCFGNAKHTL